MRVRARAKNPPAGRGRVITNDVKAIVYRHPVDGVLYVHGFGPRGDAIRLEDLRDGVAIHRLPPRRTNVAAVANPNGTVTLASTSGRRLWAEFSE